MRQFQFARATSTRSAIESARKNVSTAFIAGGTNLVDLMKRGIATPEKLVDITHLPLNYLEREKGITRIGALALNGPVAEHTIVLKNHPLLSQALEAGASAQLRNMATVGGNLMQRTRCPYFYDTTLPCNKRSPGTGCGALEGFNRMHAIFGYSDKCIAVNPSDMNVALAALDATVVANSTKGERRIPFADFHRLPGEEPEKDNTLRKGELIMGIEIPDHPFTKKIHYLKLRDRASYAFALVSVAAALDVDGGTIRDARLAMGGVAHKPWRLYDAEKALKGKKPSIESFTAAATAAMEGAKGFRHNSFKIKMGANAIVEALKAASGA